MEIRQVGVIGCGQMGGGIAQIVALAGYRVVVLEINSQLLAKGMATIAAFLDRRVAKGNLTPPDKNVALNRLQGTTDMKDFNSCDLVIEAAVENLDLKKKIFGELDKICPEQAILASNTSGLSIIDMAMATSRPDRVLGLHFFNPVPVMKLLELIRTIATSDDTFAAGKDFGQSLGKTVIVAKDTPGFIVNRLLVPQLLHAIRMMETGVATREDIDTGLTLGLNHPIGPLALSDLIGLDTLLYIANGLYDEFKEAQYVPPVLLAKMVTAGRLGRKTGTGFYEYEKSR
jgi:3-hydroxybutyryl-CoA dehydrogenase